MDRATALGLLEKAATGQNVGASDLKEAGTFLLDTDPGIVLEKSYLFVKTTSYEELLKNAAHNAKDKDPSSALEFSFLLKNKDYTEEVIKDAFFNASAQTVFNNINLLKSKDYKERLLKDTFFALIDTNPKLILENASLLDGEDYKEDVLKQAFFSAKDKDPVAVLYSASLLNGKDYKDVILKETGFNAVDKNAAEILNHLDLFKNALYREQLLQATAYSAVNDREGAQKLVEHPELFAGKSYSNDLLNALITSQNGALAFVQQFNSLHEQRSPTERFALLKHMSPLDDFNLITLGREEAYTSTYMGLFNDMVAKLTDNHKLKSNDKSWVDTLTPKQLERMDIFIETATAHDRMADVIKIIPKDKMTEILHQIVDHAATSPDLRYITSIASIITAEGCDKDVRLTLEEDIKFHFDHAKTADEKTRFGILAATYAVNAPTDFKSHPLAAFFMGMTLNTTYQVHPSTSLNASALIDKNGVCNELLVFAKDQDSQVSFEHWKDQYSNKSGWKIIDHPHYTEIVSTAGKVPIHLYANHPDQHDVGLKEINDRVALEQGTNKAAFSVFVGRGHSFHAAEYLEQLNGFSKLVWLGSCGGCHNMAKVLAKSPNAQIAATTQTGMMDINDPLLFNINQSLNQTGNIGWLEQQAFLDNLKLPDVSKEDAKQAKEAYQLPYKNLALMVLQSYNEWQQKSAATVQPAIPAFVSNTLPLPALPAARERTI